MFDEDETVLLLDFVHHGVHSMSQMNSLTSWACLSLILEKGMNAVQWQSLYVFSNL